MIRVLAIIILLVVVFSSAAAAEDGWVMCQPDSKVNVRARPDKISEIVGVAYAGDRIELTGKKSGLWLHCLLPCEAGEGWIRGDYVAGSEPVIIDGGAKYKTKMSNVLARYSMRRKKESVRKRLEKDVWVTVYLLGDEWCVTSQGYIMTDLLEAVNENV